MPFVIRSLLEPSLGLSLAAALESMLGPTLTPLAPMVRFGQKQASPTERTANRYAIKRVRPRARCRALRPLTHQLAG